MAIFGEKKEIAASSSDPARLSGPAASPRTVLGAGASFEGVLRGEGEVVVEGVLKGEVNLSGDLVVAAKGRVEAAVKARSVTVEGFVAGDIVASERVDVRATGVVEGDITTPRVAVAEGAALRGRVNMAPASSSQKPASAPAPLPSGQAGTAPRLSGGAAKG